MSAADAMKRRRFLALSLAGDRGACAGDVDYPRVEPRALQFPRDHGSHPEFRTEWWYVTGWVADAAGREYGVQVTFFRNRPGVAEGESPARSRRGSSCSRTRRWPIRGTAVSTTTSARRARDSVSRGPRRHRRGRSSTTGRSRASTVVTWRTSSRANSRSISRSRPRKRCSLTATRGYSRKGAATAQASFYYSEPQLAATGTVTVAGAAVAVKRDRVARSRMVEHRDGAGSGWMGLGGINLDDGGALMAFRMRDKAGRALWAGGTLRERRRPRAHVRAGRDPIHGRAFVALAADGCGVSGRRWRSMRAGSPTRSSR